MLPKNIKNCGLNVPSYHHRIYVRIKAAITTPPPINKDEYRLNIKWLLLV